MPLPNLQWAPETEEDFQIWARDHAAHHIGILQALAQRETTPVFGDQYILDPFDPQDGVGMEIWLMGHAAMHQQMNAVLNIVSSDLGELDWEDQDSRERWFRDNYAEHEAASRILGID